MAMATTGERLKEAMEARNYKQVDVVRKAKPLCEKYGRQLKKNALSQYIHDKVEPRRDMIALLAEALNVDDAWLTGYDVPMERNTPVPIVEDGLEKKLSSLTPELLNTLDRFLELAQADPETAERFLSFAVQELGSSRQER